MLPRLNGFGSLDEKRPNLLRAMIHSKGAKSLVRGSHLHMNGEKGGADVFFSPSFSSS